MKRQSAGFLEPLLISDEKLVETRRYYGELANITFYSDRAHFWLQYGMAELASGRYDNAGAFLRQAVDISKNWEPEYRVSVKNHYARYLLESRAREEGKHIDHYARFLEVSAILAEEKKFQGVSYYLARVCRYLAEFMLQAVGSLDARQRRVVVDRLSQIESVLKKKEEQLGEDDNMFKQALLATEQSKSILLEEFSGPVVLGHGGNFVLDEIGDR